MQFSFIVYGHPVPQGSKKAFLSKSGKIILAESSPQIQSWRQEIIAQIMKEKEKIVGLPFSSAVSVSCSFFFPFLKSQLKKDGTLKSSDILYKTTKPDLDKLIRAILDACTIAGVWNDDSQVVKLEAVKQFSHTPRAEITVSLI